MTTDDFVNQIQCGDATETLREFPESSVHMCMTSPPYFGLRDYGEDGQLGLEDGLGEYIQTLVDVGSELRRVLRDDGSWWLNLGDSYAGSGGAGGQWDSEESGSVEYAGNREEAYNGPLNESELGRKNKMLVPHRVAIALQEDGWIVRNDVTWAKPNPMPSSVKDRLNTTTEQVFHLTPEPDYWYDLDAIREPHAESTRERFGKGYKNADDGRWVGDDNPGNHDTGGFNDPEKSFDDLHHPAGKNPGDVFEVSTKPYPDAHFAVYPPELCETPIKATCPPTVCAACGRGYERVTESESGFEDGVCVACGKSRSKHTAGGKSESSSNSMRRPEQEDSSVACSLTTHVGWEQACDCDTDATVPGIVLDPFAGAGTTCMVAKGLGRRFAGIDLNEEYVAMAQERVGINVDNPEHVRDDGQVGIEEMVGE